jgi:CDP-diacylglycerol--glycerol-3-phosphate 3-phosphatidyltransferase
MSTAEIKANGFFGSSGLSGLIPDAYILMEQDFFRRMAHAYRQCSTNIGKLCLYGWSKQAWSYHAKGASPPVILL